jgi:NAD-dependent DNA ligase
MAKKKVPLPKEHAEHQPDEIRYNPIYEEMQRLRHLMIFHSQAYYSHDITFVEDRVFDKWARRLVAMQKEHPDWAKLVPYADVFADWDGSTGFHLVEVDEEKFRTRIYHSIKYKMTYEAEQVTPEMQDFMDNINRGII